MKMITHRGLDFCANLNMNNNKNSNKKKGMYCGLDCCASLNIGGGALLALHWRAPVGTSLQQLLFHNLINSTVNGDHWSPSLWMFSQWFFTRVLHCYHWPLWIYFQHSFFTHLVVSSSWQVDFITLMQTWNETGAVCFLTSIVCFEFSEDGDLNMVLMSPLCWQGRIAQRGHFRKQSRSLFYWRGKRGGRV